MAQLRSFCNTSAISAPFCNKTSLTAIFRRDRFRLQKNYRKDRKEQKFL